MERPSKRQYEEQLAYHKMSPEEVLQTENRIMTFGFGPENFAENDGSIFDETREALVVHKELHSLSDTALITLLKEVGQYKDYMSSQRGRFAAFKGEKPALTHVGNFGAMKRADFLLRAAGLEKQRRGIGLFGSIKILPKAMDMAAGIRDDAVKVEQKKNDADERGEQGQREIEAILESIPEKTSIDKANLG